MAKERAEEDESEREGDPDQVLQRQAGLHLVVGPLVGCRDTRQAPRARWGAAVTPRRAGTECKEHAHGGGGGGVGGCRV